MPDIERRASATWTGDIQKGSATVSVPSGALTGVEMGLSVAGVPHRSGGVDVAMKLLEQRPQGNSSPHLKVVGT